MGRGVEFERKRGRAGILQDLNVGEDDVMRGWGIGRKGLKYDFAS